MLFPYNSASNTWVVFPDGFWWLITLILILFMTVSCSGAQPLEKPRTTANPLCIVHIL